MQVVSGKAERHQKQRLQPDKKIERLHAHIARAKLASQRKILLADPLTS